MPTDSTTTTVSFAHVYILPLAIVLFAVFTACVLIRVVKRRKYILQIAGHAS